jgi:hypothetical protein
VSTASKKKLNQKKKGSTSDIKRTTISRRFKMNEKDRSKGKQVGRVFSGFAPSSLEMKPDECKKLCEKLGKEYLPGYEDRVLSYITTTETPDRAGDIVRASGANLEAYMKNPQVMYAHQHDQYPVGCALKIWVDKAQKNIPAWAMFLDNRVDSSGRSDLVYKFAKSRMMPCCSIGFMPTKTNRPSSAEERTKLGLGDWGMEYLEWDYLEFSPCSIPMNPDAMQNALKSANFKAVSFEQQDFDLMVKIAFMDPNLVDILANSFKPLKTISIPVTKTVDMVKCQGCEKEFDYAAQPEIAMGSVVCPNCKKLVNQKGEVAQAETPEDTEMKQLNETMLELVKTINDLVTATNAMSKRVDDTLASLKSAPGTPGGVDEGKSLEDMYTRIGL